MGLKELHAVVFKDAHSDQWVGMCLELDVVTQGDNEQHTLEMIKEAVEIHLEEMTTEEVDSLYQEIEGTPKLLTFKVNAPALLGA